MSITRDVLDLDEDGRTAAFEEIYLFKFGRLAHPGREEARKDILKRIQHEPNLREEIENFVWEHADDAIRKTLGTSQGIVMGHMVNIFVADQIVRGTVKGAVDQFGRRGAVFAIEQTSGMAAAQGAHAAFNGLKLVGKVGTLVPGLSAAIGQAIAEKVVSYAGIENCHLQNCIEIGGSIGGGVAAGALVGGPAGAAAGAAIGALGWAGGKVIDGLINSKLGFKGPQDNWCYIQTGEVNGNVCTGTYAATDSMYWKANWIEYRGSNCEMYEMSAGQAKQESFQLTVWDETKKVVTHIKNVYHRDFIFISENFGGKLYVAHGKGEYHYDQAGKIDLHSYDY